MIRLCVRYGSTIEMKNYGNLKVAKKAFADRMLDESYPDCIQLLIGGRTVASVGNLFDWVVY